MRTQKSFINTTVALASQFIIILLGFISRRVLIYSVGVQYLGINGLMTNILTIFSLAESGIGMAIGYALYEPLAQNNIEQIKSLMRFYRNVYRLLAIMTAGIGLAFYPFLPFFLKENTAPDVSLIYFLFLFSSVVSYLYSYKITLNSSDQNKYLYTVANTLTQILVLIAKVLILYFTENYILFLLLDIFSTLVKNIIFTKFLDRKYPYLKEKQVQTLDKETRNKLFINIKSLFVGKIGYILSQCSDNLVISSIVSITAVGMYSNYTTIISSVSGFVTTFSSGVTASMGNLIASESREYAYKVFKRIDFIHFWMYTFTSICLFCLMEPFVQLWLGADYILSRKILIVAVLIYYLKGLNSGIDIAKNSAGLYFPDRYVPVMEATLNLALSVVLAMKYGLFGVLVGTFVSFVVFSFWTKPYFVYRDVFHVPFAEYMEREGRKICIGVVIAIVCFASVSHIEMPNIALNFVLKAITAGGLSNGLLVLAFWKTDEFSYLKSMAYRLLPRGKHRG